MQIFSTFQHSNDLEIALQKLEDEGIKKEMMLVVPLIQNTSQRQLFDNINHSDGLSLFDLAAILGTIFSVFGVIYGFVWQWGPIIWGLIGLIFGGTLGFIIDLYINKRNLSMKRVSNEAAEVIVIIESQIEQAKIVRRILSEAHATGIAVIE